MELGRVRHLQGLQVFLDSGVLGQKSVSVSRKLRHCCQYTQSPTGYIHTLSSLVRGLGVEKFCSVLTLLDEASAEDDSPAHTIGSVDRHVVR